MHPLRRYIRVVCSSVLALTTLQASGCARQEPPGTAATSSVERGRYLVVLGGCNDCHSPKVFTAAGPVPDTTRLLSGHPAGTQLPPIPRRVIAPNQWGALASNDFTAWVGPWGVSFTPNLTPDATGIAGWTPEIFMQAMRTGKHLGVGRPILPPMPWYDLGKMSDEDLRAVFAYHRSLRPVSNPVPAPIAPVAAQDAR
jgi:mono/diheme cytochrome c family protein